MGIFDSIEQISNHGYDQGIIPRFHIQMHSLMISAYGEAEGKNKSYIQLQNVLTDFTTFYDLFQEIQKTYNDFKNGIIDGTYCNLDSQGVTQINRLEENRLHVLVKDFFIKGRHLLNNWAKSKVIDNEFFRLNDLIIVKESNFINNSNELLSRDDRKRYKYPFQIILRARKEFITEFNQLRAEIEHNNFTLPKFTIKIVDGKSEFSEPLLKEQPLLTKLKFYYDSILNFIEVLMAYKIGIDAYVKTNGFMTLFERKNPNFLEHKNRFVILPRHNNPELFQLIE